MRGEPGDRWGKYEIQSRLGRGGMGEVFLARHLGPSGFERTVVLKRVLPHLGDDPRLVEMFLAEARLTARLEHPNIVQTFELGQHEGDYFLVLEYVPGRPLQEVLGVLEGPPPPGLGAFVAREVCRALAHAHELGLVHRDVSPSNIMLGHAGGVKLLDFGVARAVAAGDLTEAGLLKGKLWYMPPERLAGAASDPRGDLYSTGLVLYETLTVRRLYTPSSPVALAELQRRPVPPPSTVNRAVPAALDRICAKAMALDPRERWASAREMAEALDEVLFELKWGAGQLATWMASLPAAEAPATPRRAEAGSPATAATEAVAGLADAGAAAVAGPPPSSAPTAPVRRRRAWLAAVLLALLVPAGVLVAQRARRAPPRPPLPAATPATPGAPAARRVLVVLGFSNLAARDDAAWLSTALTEMLAGELGRSKDIRPASGESVARMKAELGLGDGDDSGSSVAPATLARVQKDLHADLVLSGSYTVLGDAPERRVRLDVQVQDARRGDVVARTSETGREAELFDMVGHAGDDLRAQLRAEPVKSADETAHALVPHGLEAARAYAEGLERLRRHDAQAARVLLEKAVALEPDHAASHLLLASTLQLIGHDALAGEQAHAALGLVAGLPPIERLAIEARAYAVLRDWDQATDRLRALYHLFPDDIEYGIALEQAQLEGSRREEAAATMAQLRRLPSPLRDDPRIDTEAANAILDDSGPPDQALTLARAAEARAREQGADVLVADALLPQMRALRLLDRPREAMAVGQEARAIYSRTGFLRGDLRVTRLLASCLHDLGDDAGSLRLYDENLLVAGQLGDREGLAYGYGRSFIPLLALGRPAEAVTRVSKALVIDREDQDFSATVAHTVFLVDGLVALGRLDEAATHVDAMLATARRLGGAPLLDASYATAGLFLERGEAGAAERALDEGLALAQKVGDPAGDLLTVLARLVVVRGPIDVAWQLALAVERVDVDTPDNRLEAQLLVAEVELEAGHAAEAAARCAKVVEATSAGTPRRVRARTLLTRALAAAGQLDAARAELAHAEAELPTRDFFFLRLELERAHAMLDAAAGQVAAAQQRLAAVVAEAAHAHARRLELTARLTLAGIEARAPTAASRARLRALAADARRAGFTRTASAAEALEAR